MLALDFLRRIGACSLIVALSTAVAHAADKPTAKKEQPVAAEKAAKSAAEKPSAKKADAKKPDAAKKPEGKKKPAAKVSREYVSGKKWEEPKIVTPGENGGPPSDAIVLFDGKDLAKEFNGGEGWTVADGAATVGGKGGVTSKRAFGSCQLHIEWATPKEVKGEGQGRGNSGVYLMGIYEVQILDSYGNKTYFDGQAASIYKQRPPLVNASRGPGEWQTYDIIFRAPEFDAAGKVVKPAAVTVLHNGVLVQNHFELEGGTFYDRPPAYSKHPAKLPFSLQNHGNPTRFRNIWVREL
jgi:hypothetical protein